MRNLLRPVWLSYPDHRADILVGNPPWIVYRHLSAEMKDRLTEALQSYNLWAVAASLPINGTRRTPLTPGKPSRITEKSRPGFPWDGLAI